jgi:gas vesicle protein
MNKALSFLLGAVIGAAVGASVAILLAPSSGEELRGQVQDEIHRIQNEMTQAAEERRAELEEQLATLRDPRRPAGMEGNP